MSPAPKKVEDDELDKIVADLENAYTYYHKSHDASAGTAKLEVKSALLAWRDKAVVANVKRELRDIVMPEGENIYSVTRVGKNAIKRLSQLGAKDEQR